MSEEIINKENSIHCVLKKSWFEKIKSGIKTHEYRRCCPHWFSRLQSVTKYGKEIFKDKKYIRFSLGMSKDPDKNMVFEVIGISKISAADSDLIHINPNIKGLVYDIALGKRIK